MEKTVKMFVNLERKEVTIQVIYREKIFDNPAKRFIIDSDYGGFSCIEIRNGKYYYVNYLRDRNILGNYVYGSEKPIEEKLLDEEEAKKLIRETIKSHYE
jgi:hypothetical protein